MQDAVTHSTDIAALERWLLVEARSMELSAVVESLGYRLKGAGLPLDRLSIAFGLLNPSILAAGVIWRPGRPLEFTRYDYVNRNSGLYDRSPFKVAHETGRWLTLDLATTPDDAYGIIPDLKAEGLTQYVVMPLPGSVGGVMSSTVATRRPGGFTPADKAFIKAILPAVAAIVEIRTLRSTLRDLLGAYVGRLPANEIMSGTVHLGQVTEVRAAILVADLRGFTHLSTRLPPEKTADLINRYYGVVVPAIVAEGGEVLKFIGDAVLAIFPAAEMGDDAATLAALRAARAALDAPVEPFPVDGSTVPVRFGVALHLGDAVFGNVGSGDRLDFTVIGRDVNIAARIAALCSRIGRDYLVSESIAAISRRHGRSMCDAGAHEVRGLDEPLQVFVPDAATLEPTHDDGVSMGLVLAGPA
jgi:adenylate cyclase